MKNNLGAIYTPPKIVNLLVEWAIQNPTDKILDLGVGEGIFAFSSYRKLIELGRLPRLASEQIYGSEIDVNSFDRFSKLKNRNGIAFPNVYLGDFFNTPFPKVDVVIGNPPYVRRRQFSNNDIEKIRNKVIDNKSHFNKNDFSQLTDLFVYFVIQGTKYLELNGRLGVIIADSWLNVGYGKVLKRFLLDNF